MRNLPVTGSDAPLQIGRHLLTPWIKSPHQLVSIKWETHDGSGSTETETWRGQHEIDLLLASGYKVIAVNPHN